MKSNKQIKEMIASSFSKKQSSEALNLWYSFGAITEKQFLTGKELIEKEFK